MYEYEHRIPDPSEECNLQFSRVCNNCCTSTRQGESRQTLSYQGVKENDPDLDGKQSFSSGESIDSHGSPPIKGATDLNMVDCEICWEDLQLRDEIGQGKILGIFSISSFVVGVWIGHNELICEGRHIKLTDYFAFTGSFAVVYHGIWNGSVYLKNHNASNY